MVANFAVKMLLLPWKWGMKYFWDTLLDADLESNILGWQYISGGLTDGHELERLDNPKVCHVFLHSKDLQFAWYHSDVIILYSLV
ncbi:hypothetical protein JHK82_043296 [Glycine max]|uniref:Cryptochrome/DNA photolyase FAD-binding domain-containing protein n=1 Tax=Glycine max TaxID=3847 RepID=K7MD52_SOYBN|nr:hypothetical protein JHK86_043332 [Glycine max]KAG4957582.1 hypothetical protein JHK85_043962 [Glycine max]KAG5106326.1 hypothetical protein JHK82_043296 [Glycine max]